MNKFRLLILTGTVALVTSIQTNAYATTLLAPLGSHEAFDPRENATRAQVPPIYMPTEPGGKVCWQITQMTPSDQVLQSACSVPVNASGSAPLVPTPIPGPAPRPTPQPVPTTPTTAPALTPTTPVTTPVEIKIKKQEVPPDNYQSQINEHSNDQSGDKKETHSEATFIGELVLPALSVIKDLIDD